MKCIRNKNTKRITRVPNQVADLSVQSGDFEFVSKSAYRRQNLEDHKPKEIEEETEVSSE